LHVYGSLSTHLLARNHFFFPSVAWHDSFLRLSYGSLICHTTQVNYGLGGGEHKSDMTHSCVWHDSFLCETWLLPMCGVTPADAWHDSGQLRTRRRRAHEWHDSSSSSSMCDITHSYVRHDFFYVWRDAFWCVTWHDSGQLRTRRGRARVWHDSFLCVTRLMTWRIPMCDMTDGMTRFYDWHGACQLRTKPGWAQVWHDSFLCVTWLMTWLLLMCNTTQVNYGLDGGEHTTVKPEVAQLFPAKKRKSSRSLSSGKQMNIYTHFPTHTRMCVC